MDFQNEEEIVQQVCSSIESGSSDSMKKIFIAAGYKKVSDLINRRIESCGGMSFLHFSVGHSSNDGKVVRILLDHGADPNNTNCDDKVSPLHLSILYEFDVVLDILLKHGGDAFLVDGDGNNCFDLAEKQPETDLLKTILLRHSSPFSSLSSISSISSGGSGGGLTSDGSCNTFFTCENSISSQSSMERSYFDDDDEPIEPRGKRYGQLSTIKEETSSLMKTHTPPSSKLFICSVQELTLDNIQASSTPLPKTTPIPRLQQNIQTTPQLYISNHNNNNHTTVSLSSKEGSEGSSAGSSAGSPPPSPTMSEMERLELKMTDLKIPVTPTTYHAIAKFVDPYTNELVLNDSENKYSLELKCALRDMTGIHEYGNLKVDLLQNELESPRRESKAYYNYVLLDPKIIKRVNFSGHHLKSDVIKDAEKFRKFVSAVFYVGKGCGTRPLQHLVEAKAALSRKPNTVGDKIAKILGIWKSGQGVIVQSFYHHSTEREANVNEAAMIDSMGIKDLSNLRKGTYAGTQATKWNQKQKNQFGVFLLHKCFLLYAINNGKEFFPHDV